MKVLFELRTRGLTSHGLTLQEFGMSENRLTKCLKKLIEKERLGRGVKGKKKGQGDREEGKKGNNGFGNVS